ncbi:MAG: OmpA family protein [bacterium]
MLNKHLEYPESYKNRWLVSYADFVTLLLALFMVLYALSQIDISNLRDFTDSVDNVFTNVKQPVMSLKDEKQLLEQKRKLLKIFSLTKVNIQQHSMETDSSKAEVKTLRAQLKQVERNLEKDVISIQNTQTLLENKLGQINGIIVKKEPRGLLIRLKDTVLFDAGSDIIKQRAYNVLNQLAFVLGSCDNEIKIEGHTDIIPIKTAKFPSNWELSTARATNILRYFVNSNNLNPSRFSAAGYGDNIPISDNSSMTGRSANRRVDIIILNSASKIFEPQKVL